jgi:phage-related protein
MRGSFNFSRSMGRVFACHIHTPLVMGCSSYVRVGNRALVGHWSGILFFLMGKKIVVLHAFIKKSQQTPDNELKMARKRLKEVMHG